MTEQKNIVGIDVSKDDFQVQFITGSPERNVVKGSRKFPNSLKGFCSFLQWTQTKSKGTAVHFVMETTGVYYENLAYFLHENTCLVSVVLASKIKYFGKILNIKTKTDKVDAKLIAQFGMHHCPQAWKPITKELKYLRTLCREIISCKKEIVRLKNQLHALQCAKDTEKDILKLKQQQIGVFEKSILLLEKKVKESVDKDPEFAKRIKNLETIKGLGFQTIVTIVSETNGFENISSTRKVVSYSGLDVREHQSGPYAGKTRITKKGNSNIRHCLYMPALSAIQYNEPIKNLHQRIVERNPQIKQKGVVAAMRKLLILTFVLWKKNEPFDQNYKW